MKVRRIVGITGFVGVFAGVALAASAAWDLPFSSGNATAAAATISPVSPGTSSSTYNTATVNWGAVTEPVPASSYAVVRTAPTPGTTLSGCSATSCTDTGLAPSTGYTYSVTAVRNGWSSSPVPVIITTSASPTSAATHKYSISVTGSASGNSTWAAAATFTVKDGATPLQGYKISGSWSGGTGSATTTTCTTDTSGVCSPDVTNSGIANGAGNSTTFTITGVAATAPATTLPEASGSVRTVTITKSSTFSTTAAQ